jgi:hypothetical protein
MLLLDKCTDSVDGTGVCDDAVMLYHEFTATRNLVSPERTKPAVKRRRGESSLEWLAVGSLRF